MSSRPQLELHFSRSRKGREVAAVSFCDAVSFQEGRLSCHSTSHFTHVQRTRLNTQKITLLKTESLSVPIEIDTQKVSSDCWCYIYVLRPFLFTEREGTCFNDTSRKILPLLDSN
jgi:hypothetical protein